MTRPTLRSQGLVIEALRLEVSQLKADLAIARMPKAAPPVRPAYTPQRSYAQVAAHDAYVAALMAARTAAMTSGRSVRVGDAS